MKFELFFSDRGAFVHVPTGLMMGFSLSDESAAPDDVVALFEQMTLITESLLAEGNYSLNPRLLSVAGASGGVGETTRKTFPRKTEEEIQRGVQKMETGLPEGHSVLFFPSLEVINTAKARGIKLLDYEGSEIMKPLWDNRKGKPENAFANPMSYAGKGHKEWPEALGKLFETAPNGTLVHFPEGCFLEMAQQGNYLNVVRFLSFPSFVWTTEAVVWA